MKPIPITLISTIIFLAVISTALYSELNTRSTYPQPFNTITVTTSNTNKAPLILYRTNTNNYNHTLGNFSLPLKFTLIGKQNQNGTKTRSFSAILNEGDEVELRFNSTQTVQFAIYAPGGTNLSNITQSLQWYSENTTHLRSRLIALRPGAYNFTFITIAQETNVTFDAWRMKYDLHDLLFAETGGSSSAFGGVDWGSFFLGPPPGNFIVGRTWNNDTWTDRSTSFSASLNQGTVLVYGYNATEPVIFNLTSDSGTIVSRNNLYSYQRRFVVPSTGEYTFSFDMARARIRGLQCAVMIQAVRNMGR